MSTRVIWYDASQFMSWRAGSSVIPPDNQSLEICSLKILQNRRARCCQLEYIVSYCGGIERRTKAKHTAFPAFLKAYCARLVSDSHEKSIHALKDVIQQRRRQGSSQRVDVHKNSQPKSQIT